MSGLTMTIGAQIRAAITSGKDAPSLEGEAARKLIVAEFEGRLCQCGRKKAAGVAFCVKDIQALPADLYTRLWKSQGDELNAAYTQCLGVLHGLLLAKRRVARG